MGALQNALILYVAAVLIASVSSSNINIQSRENSKNLKIHNEVKRMSNKKVPVSNSVQDLIDVDPDDYTVEDLNKMAVPRSYINEAHAEFHSAASSNNVEPAKPSAAPPSQDQQVTEKQPEATTVSKASKFKNKEGDAFGRPHKIVLAKEDGDMTIDMDLGKAPIFTSFTIANTDIGIDYGQLPYRERYQWNVHSAPCHSFQLKVPDERIEESIITLCIFRPTLQFPDETKMFILDDFLDFEHTDKPVENEVAGYVMNTNASMVRGRVADCRYFYGEVFIMDPDTNYTRAYVTEEIHLLNKLLSDDPRTLKNMLRVMHAREEPTQKGRINSTVYNAVVTSGASLNHLMVCTNPSEKNINQFFILTTAHISYICPGDPTIVFDENGKVDLVCGQNEIIAEGDGSVFMTTPGKRYIFRPNGRTILQEGQSARTLQDHEGSVAITAYSSSMTYDCVLPTPAFQPKRKGGYVCKICIAVDNLFTEYFTDFMLQNNTRFGRTKYVSHVMDRVSWILRSLDFNGDVKPDNIGILFDDQVHEWQYSLDSNTDREFIEEEDVENLFRSLQFTKQDFADCCLGIGLTMKRLPGEALSRRPPAKGYGPTGICTGRSGTGRTPNNLIIITGNSYNDSLVPIKESQLVYFLANQILGAFGAMADGAGDDGCDEFKETGNSQPQHYLMWPDVMRDTLITEERLSKCSKSDLITSLSSCRSSCFEVDLHPFCGNGVVEEGEECDCGSQNDCLAQTCCDSRAGKHPCKKTGIGCTSQASTLLLPPATLVTFLSMILSAYVVS